MVRLEATIGGHRLEITRRPEYERPKSRGNGSTLQRGKVEPALDRRCPQSGIRDEGLTRADEVGDAVIDLLGMSADQFFQVVLLPQGDFARFLRADTAERGDLLERLFDTGRFGRIEDWFANLRREAGAGLRACDDEVRQRAARVAEAARVELPDDADDRWLADVRDRLADLADCGRQRGGRHPDPAGPGEGDVGAGEGPGRASRPAAHAARASAGPRGRSPADRAGRRLLARQASTAPVVAAAAVADAARAAVHTAMTRRRAADNDLTALDRPCAWTARIWPVLRR